MAKKQHNVEKIKSTRRRYTHGWAPKSECFRFINRAVAAPINISSWS